MGDKKRPEISVVIPVYNAARYLQTCIQSVMMQTLKDIEIICVNDGSTDESPALLESYVQKDSRIKIINQPNGGMSAARNSGLKLCRGKYVFFLDSDDFIAPEALALLYGRAEKTNAQIVICNFLLYFDDTGKTTSFRDEVLYYHLKNQVFTINDQPKIVACVAVWDRLFRYDFLLMHGFSFPIGMIYEDALFAIETILKADKIALVPDHLYYYRKEVRNSVTANEAKGRKHKQDFLEIHRRCQALLRESDCTDAVWQAYLDLFLEQAIMHHTNCFTSGDFQLFYQKLKTMLDDNIYRLAGESSREMIVNYACALKKGDIRQLKKAL